MKRQLLFIWVLVTLFMPITALAQPTPHTGEVDLWIEPGEGYYISFAILNPSDHVYIDIEVTSGNTIDCYFFDSSNFIDFVYEDPFTAELTFSDQSRITYACPVDEIGVWYVVLDNDALSTRKHVEGWISLTPYPGYEAQMAAIAILLLIGAVLFGLIICYKIAEPKRKQQQVPITHQAMQPRAEVDMAYCPYCGVPRHSDDALFCTTCGKSILGPEPK